MRREREIAESVCVCVCVCEREREREIERDTSYNTIVECSLCRSSTNDRRMREKAVAKGVGPFRRITGLGI